MIDYEGGRDLESLIKFVESGGTEGNEAAEDDEDYDDVSYKLKLIKLASFACNYFLWRKYDIFILSYNRNMPTLCSLVL